MQNIYLESIYRKYFKYVYLKYCEHYGLTLGYANCSCLVI